jgi:hypothetical protein
VRLLFGGLVTALGVRDTVVFGAIQARLAAAGAMDQRLTAADIRADDPRGRALRHAIAAAPLIAAGGYFTFDRAEFRRLRRERLAENGSSRENAHA